MLINWTSMTENHIKLFAKNYRAILEMELDLMSLSGLDLNHQSEALLIPPDPDQIRQLFTIMLTLKHSNLMDTTRETCGMLKKFEHPAAQRLSACMQRMQQLNEGFARVMKRYKTYLLDLKTTIKQKIDNENFLIRRFGEWQKGVTSHAIDLRWILYSLNPDSSNAEVLNIRDKVFYSLQTITPNPDRHPSSGRYYDDICNDLARMQFFYDPVIDAKIGLPQIIAVPHSLLLSDQELSASVKAVVQSRPLPEFRMPSFAPLPSFGDFPADYQRIYPVAASSAAVVQEQSPWYIAPYDLPGQTSIVSAVTQEQLQAQTDRSLRLSTAAILSAMPPTTIAVAADVPPIQQHPQSTPAAAPAKQTTPPAPSKEMWLDWMNLLAPPATDPNSLYQTAPVIEEPAKVAVLGGG
jgi:hypothetical protein